MMKFISSFLLLIATSVHAQTADEIITQYTNNMGGLAAFRNIKTIQYKGTVKVQGMDLPTTTVIVRDSAIRVETEAVGSTIIRAYANGKGWAINPISGSTQPTVMEAAALKESARDTHIVSDLMDYKNLGHQVTLAGTMKIEGLDCWEIKLVRKDDAKEILYYILKKELLLLMRQMPSTIQGNTMQLQFWYSNLKTIDGFKFFMTTDSKVEGTLFQSINLSSIELNKPVDKKLFEMPNP